MSGGAPKGPGLIESVISSSWDLVEIRGRIPCGFDQSREFPRVKRRNCISPLSFTLDLAGSNPARSIKTSYRGIFFYLNLILLFINNGKEE